MIIDKMIKKFDLVKFKIYSWQKHYEIGLYFDKDKTGHFVIKGSLDNKYLTIRVDEVQEVTIEEIIKFFNNN